MNNKHYNVPWNVVRDVVHLGYDYVLGEPSQFDFISDIPNEELEELRKYAELERHYDHKYPDGPSDWTDIVKLIVVEQEYRSGL